MAFSQPTNNFDNNWYASGTAISERTVTVDIGTRTDGLFLVSVYNRQDANIDAVTYDGVSMTEALEVEGAAGVNSALYYLANPSNGSNDIVVTLSATCNFIGVNSQWWDGADQTSPLDQTNQDTNTDGSDVAASVTPTEDNELVVGCVESASNDTLATGSGETELYAVDNGGDVACASFNIQTTAAAQNVDFTQSGNPGDDDTNLIVASFKEAAGAVANTRRHSLTLTGVG